MLSSLVSWFHPSDNKKTKTTNNPITENYMKQMNLKLAVLFTITLAMAQSVLAQEAPQKNILKCSASYANTYSQKWVALDEGQEIEVPTQAQSNGKATKKTQMALSFDNRGSSNKKLGFYVVVKASVTDNSPLGEFASLDMDIQIPGIGLSIAETSSALDKSYGEFGLARKEYMFTSNGVAHLVSCDLKKQ